MRWLSLILVSLLTSSLAAVPPVVRPAARVVPIPVKSGNVVVRDQNFRIVGYVNTDGSLSIIRGANGINQGSIRDGVIRDAKGQIIGVAK